MPSRTSDSSRTVVVRWNTASFNPMTRRRVARIDRERQRPPAERSTPEPNSGPKCPQADSPRWSDRRRSGHPREQSVRPEASPNRHVERPRPDAVRLVRHDCGPQGGQAQSGHRLGDGIKLEIHGEIARVDHQVACGGTADDFLRAGDRRGAYPASTTVKKRTGRSNDEQSTYRASLRIGWVACLQRIPRDAQSDWLDQKPRKQPQFGHLWDLGRP